MNKDRMSLGHIMGSQIMLDVSNFLRIRNNRLEVLIAGLCMGLSTRAQQKGYTSPITNKYRISYICNEITSFLLTNPSINFIVLDCRMENFFTNYIARDIIQVLDLKPNQVLVLTSTDPKDILEGYDYVIDRLADIDFAFYYSNLLKRHIDWKEIQIDIPIMSLAGRPTEHRARLTKNLIDICSDRIRVSFGNVLYFTVADKESELYSSILDPYPYPLLQNTDNKFKDHPTDIQDYTGENLFQSLISIINETNDFDNVIIQLSEKSFKHFAWHQIPIFNASRGHVEVVRGLGFDMFDDIIDHSYDNAPNSHIQKLKILNEVAKFLKEYPTIEDVNNLRSSIFHRLKSNNDILHKLYEQRPYEPWPYYG